jgi:hypothetical protein
VRLLIIVFDFAFGARAQDLSQELFSLDPVEAEVLSSTCF